MDKMEHARLSRESGIKLKTPTEKWLTKPKSLRLSINAKCYDCSNEQRIEITKCPVINCPLYTVRPFQRDEEPEIPNTQEISDNTM